MTTATKKSTIQLLADLRWFSRSEVVIGFLAWLAAFSLVLTEPDVESKNFVLVMAWCFFWSVLLPLSLRWSKNTFKGIKRLWNKAIGFLQSLDK